MIILCFSMGDLYKTETANYTQFNHMEKTYAFKQTA